MAEEAVDKGEHRLQQLEKQVRELRMTSLAGAVGVVVLCLFSLFRILSGDVPEEIRAKRFAVARENGNPGILLAIRENNPRFSLYDSDGELRAVFELQGGFQGTGLSPAVNASTSSRSPAAFMFRSGCLPSHPPVNFFRGGADTHGGGR